MQLSLELKQPIMKAFGEITIELQLKHQMSLRRFTFMFES